MQQSIAILVLGICYVQFMFNITIITLQRGLAANAISGNAFHVGKIAAKQISILQMYYVYHKLLNEIVKFAVE